MPVSEIEKVEIEANPKSTTDARSPDSDGFVTWQVELPPFGSKQLELLYTVKSHKDVVWG